MKICLSFIGFMFVAVFNGMYFGGSASADTICRANHAASLRATASAKASPARPAAHRAPRGKVRKPGEGDDNENGAADAGKQTAVGLTVAILDFESAAPGNPELGAQVSQVLTATLSDEQGFSLVDRSSLAQTLREHELNLTGLVNAEQAAKIGKLAGARILITGKIFSLDKQLFFTAKIIGVETSLVDGVLIKGDKEGDVGDLLMKLSQKVSQKLREEGPKLVASDEAMQDPLPALKKSLAGRKLPKVLVQIQERHLSAIPAPHIDPAAETEVSAVLKEAGFTVFEGDDKQAAEAGVNLIVSGDAFSEFAARIATLVNCVARVEVRITDRKTGEVLYSDRETARAVDLAENIAGKTAIQKASRTLAVRMLQYFAKSAPNARKGAGSK